LMEWSGKRRRKKPKRFRLYASAGIDPCRCAESISPNAQELEDVPSQFRV
jgi:hypothetical protein